MKKKETIRQCCITKKYFPREKLSRLVVVKTDDSSEVFFEKNIDEKNKGRSIHFLKDEKIFTTIFQNNKKKMIEHFLKTSISFQQWEKLQNKALNFFKKN